MKINNILHILSFIFLSGLASAQQLPYGPPSVTATSYKQYADIDTVVNINGFDLLLTATGALDANYGQCRIKPSDNNR